MTQIPKAKVRTLRTNTFATELCPSQI